MKRASATGKGPVSGSHETGAQPPARRTDRVGVALDPAAYAPLKALSLSTKTPIRDLLSEAVALLLLERSEPVPPALRRKVRVRSHELD